ncbi:ABC-three component system protein [Clostridioides difficile]
MDLKSSHKRQILGSFIPDINFADIKFSIVQNIVSYLSKNVSRNIFTDHLIVPDFHKKIEFNNLSSKISNALEEADSSVYKLDEFLIESYSDTFKNELCHIYKTLYNEAKELYPDESDEQFKYILNSSYDKNNTLDIQTENQYISNILIIMAKYFSSCDIFEEPKEMGLSH